MNQINVHEAKTHLSSLLERVGRGEAFVIARAGRPCARLVPLQDPPQGRRFGLLKGRIWIADDFDAPLPDEILAAFEGR